MRRDLERSVRSDRFLTCGAHLLRSLFRGRHRPPILPLLVVVGFAVLALFPDFFAPANPLTISLRNRLMPPAWLHGGSAAHLLGTDLTGRDILSRIIYGSRISLTISLFALAFGGGVGLAVALVAGYFGGWVDAILMRVVDALLAIPLILVALLLAVTMGSSERNVVLVIGALIWAQYARVLRGEVLSLRNRDYITAATAVGAGAPRIMVFHILPNIVAPLIVLLTTQIGWVVIVEASLSFLSAGVPPPAPAWGSMVADGRDVVVSAWWVSFFPGLAILVMVLAFNILGDWLRDVLDPRIARA